ncbi:MAG: hypothetical protein AB1529_07345 [Candidatus Micrarchaeota archaeon]
MRGYLIIFGLVAIVLAGCSQAPQQGGQQTVPGAGAPSQGGQPPDGSGQPATGAATDAQAEFNECINDICGAGEDNLTKICIVSCWDDYAVATTDPAKCDKNFEILNSSIGYNVCAEAVAKAKDDATPCGLIKSEFDRDLCYVELAQWLDDPGVCDKVEDENVVLTKQDCLNAVAND